MMSFYLHCARDTPAEREAEHYCGREGVLKIISRSID